MKQAMGNMQLFFSLYAAVLHLKTWEVGNKTEGG